LFALDRAREAIRREGVALFVEGYFDAVGLHQAGILTAIATCGTALTDKHLELVTKAGARELVFVFDGDAAGMRAAQRPRRSPPRRERLPGYSSLRRRGSRRNRPAGGCAGISRDARLGAAFARVPPRSRPGQLPAGAPIEARVRAVDAVKGIVQAAPSPLARDLYVEKVAEKVGAPVDAIARALAGKALSSARGRRPRRIRPSRESPAALGAEGGIGDSRRRRAQPGARAGPRALGRRRGIRSSGAARRRRRRVLRRRSPIAVRAVEPDSLRQRLLDAVGEMEAAGDHTDAKRLSNLVRKHAQTVARNGSSALRHGFQELKRSEKKRAVRRTVHYSPSTRPAKPTGV